MFNPHKRIFAQEKYALPFIQRGQLVRLTGDLETGGVGRSRVPYATPASAFPTEIGFALGDFAGNFGGTWQVFPKRPDHLAFEPAAALIARVQEMGPELYDDEGRTPFNLAAAATAWYIKESAFAYEDIAKQFGDPLVDIHLTDFNKQYKDGQKAAADQVYNIPLIGADGEITHNARYHPVKRKISWRFTREGSDWQDQNYRAEDNLYYRDENDDSLWKWVEPVAGIRGYNFARYDLPLFRSFFYRAGFSAANTTFLYARGTPTSKQRPRPYLVDVRDMAHMTMLFGPQGEDALRLGKINDYLGAPVRESEALGAILEEVTGHANPLRFIKGGPFNPMTGDFFDEPMAHGAVYDALITSALENHCWNLAPDLCMKLDEQADKNKFYGFLTRQNPDGTRLPFFALPRKEAGKDHSDLPYMFLGTDDQIGRFNEVYYLRADGDLHKTRYHGKLLKDLSVENWVDFMKSQEGNPDRIVRKESFRRKSEVLDVSYVLKNTAQGNRYADMIDDMMQDGIYFAENPEMRERIMQAVEMINHERRFGAKLPHNPNLEDTLNGHYAGEVFYQEEEREIERRMIWHKTSDRKGASQLPGILQMLKAHMDNDYKYMRSIDEGMSQLCLTAHVIDFFKDFDLGDHLHEEETPEGRFAAAVYEDFCELAERLHKKFSDKKYAYTSILDEIINPATGEPFFKGHKFQATTPAQAYQFREALGLRYLESMEKLGRYKKLPAKLDDYMMRGVVDQDFDKQYLRDYHLALFADADNGQSGATPHVVNKHGAEVDIRILKGLNAGIDYAHGSNQNVREHLSKMIDTKEWSKRFYQDRALPGINRLLHRFISLDRAHLIPESVLELYKADFENRMGGMDNETAVTDRATTLRSMEYELDRLEMAASANDPRLLERDPNPHFSAAARALKYEEGQQRLVYIRQWIEKMKLRLDQYDTGIVRRTDPETKLPFDQIHIIVPRESTKAFEKDSGFTCMDIPHAQLAFAMENENPFFSSKGIVLPDPKSDFRRAVERKKPVLLRSYETGQVFATGPAELVKMPGTASDPAFTLFREQAEVYERAGVKIQEDKPLWFLGIEDIYPLANTRPVDFAAQAIKLPKLHFEALTMPEYAAMGKVPLSAVLTPIDYYPQRVEVGQALRLKEMSANMFANIDGETDAPETGHTYETVLTHVIGLNEHGDKVGLSIRALFEKIRASEIAPEIITAMGFMGPDHLETRLDEWTTKKWKTDPLEQRVIVSLFKPVNKEYFEQGRKQEFNKWAYCPQDRAPRAALSWDGNPVSPNMYKALPVLPDFLMQD